MPNTKITLLIAVATLLLLLFVGKAINIDDVPFIAIARQISHDPFHPYSFSFSWGGREAPAYDMADPPLIMYYLALVIKLFGEKEAILHLAMLPFTLVVLFSTYRLSQSFTKYPLIATLLVLVSPAFFVSATTIMMDIPFLAFSLLGIACFLQAVETRPGLPKSNQQLSFDHWIIASALATGATSLIKYTAIVPAILIGIGLLLHRRFRSLILFTIILAAMQLAWQLYFFSLYGKIHPLHVQSLITASALFRIPYAIKMFFSPHFLTFCGGSLIFVTPFLLTQLSGRKRLFIGAVALIHLALALNLRPLSVTLSPVNLMLFYTFIANGALIFGWLTVYTLTEITRKNWNPSEMFLVIWIVLGYMLPLLLSPFVAVRYLLFLLIPLAILVSRNLSYNRLSLWGPVGVTLWISLMVTAGDTRWADAIKRFVETNRYNDSKTTVWYIGHWGLQYYVEKEGKSFLDLSVTSPKSGDLLLRPTNIPPQDVPDLSHSQIIDTIELYHGWPVVTMYWPEYAGWYSHASGFMPYIISNGPIEVVYVWKYQP